MRGPLLGQLSVPSGRMSASLVMRSLKGQGPVVDDVWYVSLCLRAPRAAGGPTRTCRFVCRLVVFVNRAGRMVAAVQSVKLCRQVSDGGVSSDRCLKCA